MGRHYQQLSLDERCTIAQLLGAGCSHREIAATLDRSPPTVSREVARNRDRRGVYRPGYADQQTRARRWRGARLERDAELREAVLVRLAAGWSPGQVAGRLARDAGHLVLSAESIYRFIYAQLRRTKDYRWRHYLPHAKSKRGWRRRRRGSARGCHITGRVPIAARPPAVATRRIPGHWEGDLMLFATYGQALLAAHERTSRLLLLTRQPNKSAAPVASALEALFGPLPPALRQSITFDNGTEFARHTDLHALGVHTYFCDPHSPWQKGGIENAIGRVRPRLPRKTDLATLPDPVLHAVAQAYNHTPRKCLDFRTPAEVFLSLLLHFECESTFPRSRE